MSQDSVVGIRTGYLLDDRGIGVQVPAVSKMYFFPRRPDRIWGPPSLLSNWYRGRGGFLGCRAAGAWSWPLISNYCRGQENLDLYIHSPISLHGVVLNSLSTGTSLPFFHRSNSPKRLFLSEFSSKIWYHCSSVSWSHEFSLCFDNMKSWNVEVLC
jgi:hypothetical protein